MEDARKVLTGFYGHFCHFFITKIMRITVYLSSDVRMVDGFVSVVKTIDEIWKKKELLKYFLLFTVPYLLHPCFSV